ncbi:MAG: VWA domain-containing protein [Myxococcales bacterium]|nr:VWA domain-containing protein [Myxococcales bacterium]MCB9737273.1 VWA domain-containing protein [Deltaproteobacteria bacterium]
MDRFQQHFEHLKRAAAAVVERRGLKRLESEVVFILDVSRSMFPIYRARLVQELATQLLALSLNFDDDGVIPAYAFGDRCRHLGDLTVDDFVGYVDREVIRTGADYQVHCRYAPVIDDVCRYYFPEDWDQPALVESVGRLKRKEQVVYPMLSAPRAYPVFAIFVTGGDCEDMDQTADLIRRSSRLPIFWQFVGLAPPDERRERFRFLRRLDTLGNTYVDNCGFFEPNDVRNSETLFDGLLNEFPSYLMKPAVQGMLLPEEMGGKNTRGERRSPDEEAQEVKDLAKRDVESVIVEKPRVRAEVDAERERALRQARMEEERRRAELEKHTSIDAIRAKLAEVEWVEGTIGGAGKAAPRAAAPVAVKEEEEEESVSRRRRLRPSEQQPAADEGGDDDPARRIRERMARLRAKLAAVAGDDDDDATIMGSVHQETRAAGPPAPSRPQAPSRTAGTVIRDAVPSPPPSRTAGTVIRDAAPPEYDVADDYDDDDDATAPGIERQRLEAQRSRERREPRVPSRPRRPWDER